MAPASQYFLSSFWDSINDLSPQKKQPPLRRQSPTQATTTLSSTATAALAAIEANKNPQSPLEGETEKQVINHIQKVAGKSNPVADLKADTQHDARGHTAATATSTATARAIASSPPHPQRTQRTLSTSHSRRRQRQRRATTTATSSSFSVPKPSSRATAAATRVMTPRAATTKNVSSPSSDPYDIDSVAWEEEPEQQKEEQEEHGGTLVGDNEQYEDARSKLAAQPGKTAINTSTHNDPRYYEVERILAFRRFCRPDPESTHADAIELLVHWAGYDDPADQTWEDEDELQLTARDVVLEFWESQPMGGRDAALGISANGSGSTYRALQVLGGPKVSSKKAAGMGKGKIELFHVEWVGYRAKTWESSENLPKDMIQAYLDDQKMRRSKKRKRTAKE